jgi:sugar (pentulose or hexulose) kinase
LKDIGDKPSEIRLSGGIMNSPYWRQMAADIFGEDLFYTGVVHESTVGAALLALKACGGVHNLQSFRPPLQGKITPDAQRHQLYGERFQQYLRYYDCVTEE